MGARPFNTPKICAVVLQLPYKTAFDRVQAHSFVMFRRILVDVVFCNDIPFWFTQYSRVRMTSAANPGLFSIYRVKMTT